MAAETYNIIIDGCWSDIYKGSVPKHSGVYFVYECTHNKEEKTVSIHRLIYIGESDNVNDRIANHEKHDDWMKHVRKGNTLCFLIGPVSTAYRERVEAAFIFKHKPPENEEYIDSFPFDQTTVNSSGITRILNTSFTVNRTD